MKSISTLLGIIICTSLHAQPSIVGYQLSTTSSPYTTYANGLELFETSSWYGYEGETFSFPFQFPFLDTAVSSMRYEVSGRLVITEDHSYFADVYTQSLLQDLENLSPNENSPITVHTIQKNSKLGIAIQVSRANYVLGTDTVSFQVKFWEDGVMEYHVGPHSNPTIPAVTDMGPLGGCYHMSSFNPFTFVWGQSFRGNPFVASDSTYTGVYDPFPHFKFDTLPPPGTLITYTPVFDEPSSVLDRTKKAPFRLFQNRIIPTVNGEHVVITTINGRVVFSGKLPSSGVLLPKNQLIFITQSNRTFNYFTP